MMTTMSTPKPTLTVAVTKTSLRRGNFIQPHYACEVAGVVYTNSSKAELRSVIARRNPGFKVVLDVRS